MVLQNISSTFKLMGKNINIYYFVPTDIFFYDEELAYKEIDDEFTITIPEEDLIESKHLNHKQKDAYNLILQTLL